MGSDIEDLLRIMGRNEKLRFDVRDKILKGGKGVLEHLVRVLKSNPNITIRRNAALILGEIGNKKAVDALIAALKDRAASVSSNAAIALGMIGDKRAVAPLIEKLHAPAWQIRLNAAISLGWIADEEASDSLLVLLRDHHAYVRRGAAFALGQIKNLALRDSLLEFLTNPNEPVYESAVVLASMGDLTGYFYLDSPLPVLHEGALPKNTSKRAVQALKLGNLFYSSALFPSALTEYRRALAIQEKNSATTYASILNNLGNTFRVLGQPDHAIVFYLLGLRIKAKDTMMGENLKKAETLSDIQELVLERVKGWIESHKSIEPPYDFVRYYRSLSNGLSEAFLQIFLKHFVLGWKGFHALEAFRGEGVAPVDTPMAMEFLLDHVHVCRSVLTKEPSFRSFYNLLLKISDGMLSAKDQDASDDTLSLFHESFLYGYIVGLLQKIWWLSHLRFSLN